MFLTAILTTFAAEIKVLAVDKVSQVTGQTDRQRQKPTDSQTESRFGLRGTDLGASFEHNGKLVFLFGDTWPTGPNTPDRPVDGDSIAYSSDTNPDNGLKLDFITAPDGKYGTVKIPGVSLAGFEVPNGGFSHAGYMYGFYTTAHRFEQRGVVMGRSVLARSKDGLNWVKVLDLSSNHFVNVSPQIVDASKLKGFPVKQGKVLFMWASGAEYRRSSPRLAYVPLKDVDKKSAYRYWDGNGWSPSEDNAKALFDHPVVGELSVAWNPQLGRYIMLYNSDKPRGITLRSAKTPWGPWSDPTIVFDPDRDGYGKFMHISWKVKKADSVHDPGRENDYGGEYGPYMIPKFFKGTQKNATVYFLMSTWNPYNVVLMRARLSR
ncbi:MAG: DUF4185 domain-containing protein [Fimbriimonadaceae bacterium]|nr:DUF4185 domain-containing protein [Fimbriimonadaceae bacterium]